MATTITKALADTYFGETIHTQYAVWTGFTDNMRTAAVAQAKDIISRYIGEDITAETQDTDYDSMYYPDRAVYEQALHILVNSTAIANGEQTGPKFLALDSGEGSAEPKRADGHALALEARKWLGIPDTQIEINRG